MKARRISWIATAGALAFLAIGTSAAQETTDGEPVIVVPDSTLTITAPAVAVSAPIGGVSPAAAVLMTPVFPGWGQLHAGGGWRAVVAFAYESWFVTRAFMYERKAKRYRLKIEGLEDFDVWYQKSIPEYYESMRDNWWWVGGAVFFSAIDAYVGAHLHDFERDAVPVPEGWDPAEVPQPIELPTRAPTGAVLMSWSADF